MHKEELEKGLMLIMQSSQGTLGVTSKPDHARLKTDADIAQGGRG